MAGQSSPESIYTRLQRIAELSRTRPAMTWTTLAHHIDIEFLREAFKKVRKEAAPGVDGQTAAEYAVNLEANLTSLLTRFKTGAYRAPPVKRVFIPKEQGKERPIGIPTIEDKILQRAVTTILGAVYEQDFLDCSFGFRPKRSAHQALERLRTALMEMRGGYVLELDITSFFDTMDHKTLNEFLDKRIRDGVIRRAIGKWLNAGIMQDGEVRRGREGTPQGGVISPLLANLYLHEVLDVWFEQEVRPRMRGEAAMVRYADDAVLVFAWEDDARRVLEVLPKRFENFGLQLHPEKTRLVRFKRPEKHAPDEKGPGSFDFLGFTHYWGKSRKANNVVWQKTAKNRLRRVLRRIWEWCREHRHLEVKQQQATLGVKVTGHCAYYGITGNGRALNIFTHMVRRIWRYWLDRRSWRARMPWDRFNALLLHHPLPNPRIVHSYVARP